MTTIDPADPLAVAVVEAIQTGDQERLARLLATHPGLATARLGDDRPGGMTRTLLHAATDWPGHFPNGPATVGPAGRGGRRGQRPLRRRQPRRDPTALGGQQRRRRGPGRPG